MNAVLDDQITFWERDTLGQLTVRLHPGQIEALNATERFVVVVAGTQSGKTSFGPMWLIDEIMAKGPGDYLVVTPTFQLLDIKLLPELRRYIEEGLGWGRYWASPRRRITFNQAGEISMFGSEQDLPTNIFFGYADDPESLESSTVKAAWLDEAGQSRFRLESFNAILRRLSLSQGRVLITTTPYNLGWLYQRLYQRWLAGDPEIRVISFESLMNPTFPRAEWERAKADLPRWMFDMFYRGRFTRPAGQIYDNFDPDKQTIEPFQIPRDWPRFIGLDFGGVNTAALFYAGKPGTPHLLLYHEYLAGGRTAREHAEILARYFPSLAHVTVCGGSKSEGQWRQEFAQAGLPVLEPVVSDVEVGIQRVYAAHQQGRIFVMKNCVGYLDQKARYSRPVDANGQVQLGIQDKNAFHFMDAERYIVGRIMERGGRGGGTAVTLSRGGPRLSQAELYEPRYDR